MKEVKQEGFNSRPWDSQRRYCEHPEWRPILKYASEGEGSPQSHPLVVADRILGNSGFPGK